MRHGVFLVGTEKPSPWPCSNHLCPRSPDMARKKYISYLSQVIFNLLFSPENSTNSKLQVPLCITTPQKGFSLTGAIVVLWSTHSAHCSFKRTQKKNNPNYTIITTKNHLSIISQMITPTSSHLLKLLPTQDLTHSTLLINTASSPCPPLLCSCHKILCIYFSDTCVCH